VLPGMTVLVKDGRIAVVGPAGKISIPEGTSKIDAAGQYLIPGLTDAHVHLQSPTEFPLFLANGVTTVFNLDGRPAHLLWRKRIENGEVSGPRIFTTGPIFTRAHKPDVAVRMVDEQAELGYDAVKIYNGVSKEEYPALIAEAKRKHLLLMGHIAREPNLEMTVAAGQSIAHLEEFTYTFSNPAHDGNNNHIVYDEKKIPQAVQLTAKSGVFVTPTLSTYATIVQQATDLVLLDGNPLADITKTRAIAGVVVNSRWIARNQLDREVSKVPEEYARQVREMQSRLDANPEQALKTLEENDPFRRLGATALAGIAADQGMDKLRAVVRLVREKQPNSGLVSEESINSLGYRLLEQKKYADAVSVLRMNTEDFPKSANTWDSLGEALFDSGDTPHALENYKKALEADPKYENAEAARKFVVKYEPEKKQDPH
jgi:tetratricopeptide (TPR) repeat protein